jgi:hypothetical protein
MVTNNHQLGQVTHYTARLVTEVTQMVHHTTRLVTAVEQRPGELMRRGSASHQTYRLFKALPYSFLSPVQAVLQHVSASYRLLYMPRQQYLPCDSGPRGHVVPTGYLRYTKKGDKVRFSTEGGLPFSFYQEKVGDLQT